MAVAVCLTAFIGCGGSDGKFAVEGTVSYGGQPVEDGAIVFMPLSNEPGASESFLIKNGAFSGRLPEGKRNVQIHGFRPGEPVVDPLTGKSTIPNVQYVHGDYNVQTKLTVDVVTGMKPMFFDLEAIPLPPDNKML